jgi:predicted N-acetyltransferase YhbS
MIFLREVSFENQNVLIGGLGGLCVDEKYRNQGIATKLLSEAMEILKELNCDISILFTDIDYPPYVKLYGRFGFVLLGREYCFMDRVGKTKTNNNAMIAPVNSTDKYNLILDSKEILNIGAGEW